MLFAAAWSLGQKYPRRNLTDAQLTKFHLNNQFIRIQYYQTVLPPHKFYPRGCLLVSDRPPTDYCHNNLIPQQADASLAPAIDAALRGGK
jgi:hypothetical protein